MASFQDFSWGLQVSSFRVWGLLGVDWILSSEE